MMRGGPLKPVQVISASDLRKNGGEYILTGGPAIRVNALTEGAQGRKTIGGPAIVVYPITQAQLDSGEFELTAGGEALPVIDAATISRAGTGRRVAIPVWDEAGLLLNAGGQTMLQRIESTSPDVWLKLDDASGTVATDSSGNGVHGLYSRGSVYDVGNWIHTADAGLEGETLPRFGDYDDGTFTDDHFVDLLAGNGFDTVADWDEVSMMVWARVHVAGVWTDATFHTVGHFESADGPGGINRWYMLRKTTNNNEVLSRIFTNGDSGGVIIHNGIDTTGWFQVLVTVSRSANEHKLYINNVQVASTEPIEDDWTETALDIAVVGAQTASGAYSWDGYLQHFCVWNRILSDAERSTLQPYTTLYDPSA